MFVQLHCNYTINVLLIMNNPNVANLAEILHARLKARKMGTDIQDQQSLTNETGFRAVSKSDETPSKQMLVEL